MPDWPIHLGMIWTCLDVSAPDDRGFEGILSGDIGTPANDADNCHHILTGSATDATAILDGFTISDGNASGSGDHCHGGGICDSDSSSPTLCNCTLSGNSALVRVGLQIAAFVHPVR